MQNYYEILDIDLNADKTEIKRAYIKKIKLHTPEKDPDNFRRIRTAYEVLLDNKKRKEYNRYFEIDADYRQEIMHASQLLSQSKYPQAIEVLLKADARNPDQTDICNMLGKAYMENGNYGKAIKIYEKLCSDNGKNQDAALALAQAYEARGFRNKAESQYLKAIEINKRNSKTWIEYIKYVRFSITRFNFFDCFNEAFSIDQYMFKDEPMIYMTAAHEAMYYKETELVIDCIHIFAALFSKVERPSDDILDEAIRIALQMSLVEQLRKDVKSMLPVIEKNKYRKKEYAKSIETIRANFILAKVDRDKKINKKVAHLLNSLQLVRIDEFNNEDTEIITAKMAVMVDYNNSKTSIERLKSIYPELYSINEAFFDSIADEKERNKFIKKHKNKVVNDFKSNNPLYDDDIENDFDDYSPYEQPYVRTEKKVGRNEPCPCNSGKKYKQCCGKN